MPKTSIGRKKLDSKHKREFTQREKGRQIKKNKGKTQLENMYVDKLKKINDKTQKMKEEVEWKIQQKKKIEDEKFQSEESDQEEGEQEIEEMDVDQVSEAVETPEITPIIETQPSSSELNLESNLLSDESKERVMKLLDSKKRKDKLVESFNDKENDNQMDVQQFLIFIEVSRKIIEENKEAYFGDNKMRKVMTQNMTDIALRMSNMGLKQFNEVNHNKFVDLKKATGHMSQKQMEYLRVFSANYVNCLILSSELKDQEVADTFLDNMQMLKCIVPFQAISNKLKSHLLSKDSEISRQMIIQLIKYQIYTNEDELLQNRVFEENFKMIYDKGLKGEANKKLFDLILKVKPDYAQELGFLEVRQLSLKVREFKVSKVVNQDISQIYNKEFLDNIKIWIQIGKSNEKSVLMQPIQALLLNILKLSSDLKFHPFHTRIYDLLREVSVQGSIAAIKFVLYPFSQEKIDYFKQKGKDTPQQNQNQKSTEDLDDGIQIQLKQLYQISTKERILRNTLVSLTQILQNPQIAKNLSFPEIILPVQLILKSFKKQVDSVRFQKIASNYLENVIDKHANYVLQKRISIKDKNLRAPDRLQSQITSIIGMEKMPIDQFFANEAHNQTLKTKNVQWTPEQKLANKQAIAAK